LDAAGLGWNEKAQARVRAELKCLTDDEKLRKIREMVETGALAQWRRRLQAEQEFRRAS